MHPLCLLSVDCSILSGDAVVSFPEAADGENYERSVSVASQGKSSCDCAGEVPWTVLVSMSWISGDTKRVDRMLHVT